LLGGKIYISIFDRERSGFGGFWWRISKGTKIPAGLRISMDFNPKLSSNPTHYTIRPLFDMPLMQYITLLEELALSAEQTFDVLSSNKAKG